MKFLTRHRRRSSLSAVPNEGLQTVPTFPAAFSFSCLSFASSSAAFSDQGLRVASAGAWVENFHWMIVQNSMICQHLYTAPGT